MLILLTFTYRMLLIDSEDNSQVLVVMSSIIMLLLIIFLFLVIKNKSGFLNNSASETASDLLSKGSHEENDIVSVSELIKMALENNQLFYFEFIKVFPAFSSKLLSINAAVKSSDLELCAMIKLNLDTKQIAQAKQVSVKSIESKKYRIRKKLLIPSDIDMYIWMSKF